MQYYFKMLQTLEVYKSCRGHKSIETTMIYNSYSFPYDTLSHKFTSALVVKKLNKNDIKSPLDF